MSKGCYTCRRRRIICDNGLPTCRKCRDAGKECLGYQKPLVWVKGGVASRGKMMGRSFGDAKNNNDDEEGLEAPSQSTAVVDCLPDGAESSMNPEQPIPDDSESDGKELTLTRRQQNIVAVNSVPTPRLLVDPLFKDCNRLSRFYIDHFNRNLAEVLALYSEVKNPFRDLISLVGDSPVIAHSLAAMGALHYVIVANGEFSPMPWPAEMPSASGTPPPPEGAGPAELSSLSGRSFTQVYEHFLGMKQRALHQLSQDISDPSLQNDNRTLAAILVLALMDAIESGHGAWKFHIEGAKKLLQSRERDRSLQSQAQTQKMMTWLDDFATDGCLVIQLMGATLARPGSLSKPLYTSAMGAPALKRLEQTSWVGCPAYLLEAIFFVHAFFDLDLADDPSSQPSTVFPSAYLPLGSNPLQCPENLARHIQAFDPVAWAESLQDYLFLPDLSMRIALATSYKAAVYLYATRVLSRPRPGATSVSTNFGLPPDHAEVAALLIHQFTLIHSTDPHFKCLIWPSFIAGAECRDPAQRPFLLQTLRALYFNITSVNVRNSAWVLTMMWQKRDVRREERLKLRAYPDRDRDSTIFSMTSRSPSLTTATNTPTTSTATPSTTTPLSINDDYYYDDDDFDWVQELDDSRIDWLFI
ncbi:fungal-specific transcription factor domain-containing protein [Aspergillus pseudoustus]|uniref:Fungal-specific transcription factor domain-containing protein n=1 Tax=Aspergillus pseudoustus TaxID=1810923 RepID=A0ABR4KRN5_9EURO